MLGGDNYAFCKEENKRLIEIKEKEPFTNDKMSEFASNGTYYFKSGSIVKKYFQKLVDLNICVNNEFYVSMVYNLMKQDDLKAEAQTVKIQSLLAQHLEKYSLDINDLKEYAIKEGFEWNPKWVTVERIDPAAAMSFITVLKANSSKN
jgi:hypothetical protein